MVQAEGRRSRLFVEGKESKGGESEGGESEGG